MKYQTFVGSHACIPDGISDPHPHPSLASPPIGQSRQIEMDGSGLTAASIVRYRSWGQKKVADVMHIYRFDITDLFGQARRRARLGEARRVMDVPCLSEFIC